MSRKTLYVHIGVHRTATSSIQAYLRDNAEGLAAQGYQLALGRGRQQALVDLLFDGARPAANVAINLEKAADASPDPIHSVILSDEDISLRARLTPFAEMRSLFDVKIVVALRRQDLWLESWYFQNVKWQWNKRLAHLTLGEFLAKVETFHWIDYDAYLAQLESDFGRENILVSVFERGQMPDGPVHAFAAQIGLETEGLTEPPHTNSSYSPLITEFARHLPLDSARPRVRAQIEQGLAHADAQLQATPEEGASLLLSPKQRARILKRFAKGNRAVAQRYFGRDVLFHDPLPPEDAPIGKLELPQDSDELMRRVVTPMMEGLIAQLDKVLK